MNPTRWHLLARLLSLALAGLATWDCGTKNVPNSESPAGNSRRAGTSALPFNLYFPASDGMLHSVRRTLEVTPDPAQRARALLQALLAGPNEEGLVPPFEKDTEVASALLSESGVLYVDLRAPQPAPPSLGSRDELLTVYSVVNTAVLNVPEARRVVLLWNGTQLESLGGHVDTARPLRPNHGLVAPAAAPGP